MFQVRCHSLTLQLHVELHFEQQTVADWSQFFCKAMSNLILICSSQLFLMVFGGGRGGGKVVEVHDRGFSRHKGNCGRLRVTAWVFVGVKGESGIPVLHLSLIALLRHCSPSLRYVSYAAPQSSVTAVGYNVRLCNVGLSHHSVNRCVSFVARGCSQIRSSRHECKSTLTSGLTEKTKLNVC